MDEKRGEKVTLVDWDRMERSEKEEIVKNIEKESLKEKGERLAKSWKVWREEGPPFTESNIKICKNPLKKLPELENEEIHETSAKTILQKKPLVRSSKIMMLTSNYPPYPPTKHVYNHAPHADEQHGCDCGDDPHENEVLEPETEIETVNPPLDELSEIRARTPI